MHKKKNSLTAWHIIDFLGFTYAIPIAKRYIYVVRRDR